jgi:hypothetical protein
MVRRKKFRFVLDASHPNLLALEAQTFSMNAPEYFFNIYSPPRNESGYQAARNRLEEDLRFASKTVRYKYLSA